MKMHRMELFTGSVDGRYQPSCTYQGKVLPLYYPICGRDVKLSGFFEVLL